MTKGVPPGYATVTPWVVSPGTTAQVIDWLVASFDATETVRLLGERGEVTHAEVKIGDSVVLLFDAEDDWRSTPALIRLYLPNAVAALARAVNAGGTVVTRVKPQPFGDALGRVEGPGGHLWWVCENTERVSQSELQRRLGVSYWQKIMSKVWADLQLWMRHD